MKLGEKIKAARQAKGWYQHQLAKAVGVEPPTVSRWETGFAEPDSQNLFAIAKALEKPLEWFQKQTISIGEFEKRLAALEARALKSPASIYSSNPILQKLWPVLLSADPAIQRACLYLCTGLEEDAVEMEESVQIETKVLRSHLKSSHE